MYEIYPCGSYSKCMKCTYMAATWDEIYSCAWNLTMCMKSTHAHEIYPCAWNLPTTSYVWNLPMWQRPHEHEIYQYGSYPMCMKCSHMATKPPPDSLIGLSLGGCFTRGNNKFTIWSGNIPQDQQEGGRIQEQLEDGEYPAVAGRWENPAAAGRLENHGGKGKCENPGSWRITELQECLLVIWLKATTVVRYFFLVAGGI